MAEWCVGKNPREIVGLSTEPGFFQGFKDVRIFHIEFDLFEDHPSLKNCIHKSTWSLPQSRSRQFEQIKHTVHATAVASIFLDRTFGLCPDSRYFFKRIGARELAAVIGELENKGIQRGDIFCLSLQHSYSKNGKVLRIPIDFSTDTRDKLNSISMKGAVVFIASGNSGLCLNFDPIRWDGGEINYREIAGKTLAIKVGCLDQDTNCIFHSNYASGKELFIGASNVKAACHNTEFKREHNLFENDIIETFTCGFSKTSAATPIVAGIAACIQKELITRKKRPLDHQQMLEVIEGTSDIIVDSIAGAPQQIRIKVPNLLSAIRSISSQGTV